MESIGYTTREIRELPSYPKYEKILKSMIHGNIRAGAAADLSRVIIAYDEGGLYLDLDFYINAWSTELHYLFDLVGFATPEHGHALINNMGFMAKPKHPVAIQYLKYVYDQIYEDNPDQRILNKEECWDGLAGVTLYDTGPALFATSFYHAGQRGT